MSFLASRRPAAALCAVLLFACAAGPARPEDAGDDPGPSLGEVTKLYKSAIGSKNPDDHARAFDCLRPCRHAAALDLVADGLDKVRKWTTALEKKQVDTEAQYEALIDKGHELQQDLDTSARSARDVQRFNDKARKIDFERQRALEALRGLETEFARLRALDQLAALVAAEILGRLDQDGMADGMTRLEKAWLGSRDERDRVAFIHAVWDLPAPLVSGRLHALLDDTSQGNAVRVAAMGALATKRDEGLLAKAIALLTRPPEDFALVTAALGTLRRLHVREGIEPLIDFLAREDIGRLREDAHLALLSLTGQAHGPYADPWRLWWQESKKDFVLPKDPAAPGRVDGPGEGVTFYDIHTFSDRVLFIVDISGSMDKVDGDPQGRTKWDIAEQQLKGAIHGLDAHAVFNVVFFNHGVVAWQRKVQPASENVKSQLEKWVDGTAPVGGTNIHDALEMGFGMAQQATGRPILDTVFFLTDGKPTAGKIQDPQAILESVRQWNATAQLRLHAIGIGSDHDVEFMKELARIGDGQYVAR